MAAPRRVTLTPGQRAYRPYGAGQELLYCKLPEVTASGPAGTGKSRAALEKLHLCAEKYAGMRGLIVRKTRASLTESALVTYEQKVLPEGHAAIAKGGLRRIRQSYQYANGSEIIVGGMDNATRVMSTEYDLIYVQEAIELGVEDWENLTTRLRNGVMPYQQLLADTNPHHPRHWLKLRCDAGKCRMLESRHEDNPTLYDHQRGDWTEFGRQYLAKLDNLTGARYWRLRKGLWVAAEGLVYEDWDPLVHLIQPFPIPKEWRRIRVIDFGFTNPFVCQWWALDHDGRMYRYREIYRTQRTVADHAVQIKELSEGEEIEATIADHDAEDRATLLQHGIKTVPAFKGITSGIEAAQLRFRKAGDGRPRIFLFRDALVETDEALAEAKKPCNTDQEIDGYAYPKGKDGKPVKEVPVDLDNHGMDALRYAVAYVDNAGRVRRKIEVY